VSSIFVKFDKIRSFLAFWGIGSAAFSFRSSPRFGPGVEMCELSELSELSLGRELSPAIGDSNAGKICDKRGMRGKGVSEHSCAQRGYAW
jgi:hypothetical protein